METDRSYYSNIDIHVNQQSFLLYIEGSLCLSQKERKKKQSINEYFKCGYPALHHRLLYTKRKMMHNQTLLYCVDFRFVFLGGAFVIILYHL